MDEPRRPSHAPWALALAAVAIGAIVMAGALYVFALAAVLLRRFHSGAWHHIEI